LPDVVHRCKSFTTSEYRIAVKQSKWMPFPGRLRQRNYYDHVIRDGRELQAVRQYTRDNPLKWDEAEENPHPGKSRP
jgi:putative transposase